MTDLVPLNTYELIPQAYDLADKLARTDFVPAGLRGKPEAVMAAMLQGHEVGLPPMMSLSKIAVIQGTPAMRAEAMRALVLSHGHDVWFEEKNNTKVTICGRRRDTDRVSKITWTMDDAVRAGLAGKDGWKKYPRAYLAARATSELCRDLFADVLGGISYTPEEAEDFDGHLPPDPEGGDDSGGAGEAAAPSTARRARAAVTKKAAAKRAVAKKAPPVAPGPRVDEPPAPPLPGEDGFDTLELEAGAVREHPGGDEVSGDGSGEPLPAADIDLPATLEQANLPPAKFLREVRRVAAGRGEPQPATIEAVTDVELIAATLDDLGIAPMLSTTVQVFDSPAATEARNSKMWAMVAEAWPDDDEERDGHRRHLIGIVTDGRTTSSKQMSVEEWDDLFLALDDISEGRVELHLRASGDWTLRPVARRS